MEFDYLDETERNKVLEYACNLQISQSTRLHKMLVQYKKDIADYKSKLKEVQSRPYYNSRHNKPENEPEFFKEMSDECASRAIAILDTIFKTIESLGGSINSDLSVKIRGDIVRFCMVESQDQVKHEMTKQEAQALVNIMMISKIIDGLQNLKLESMTRYIMVNFVLCLGREAT